MTFKISFKDVLESIAAIAVVISLVFVGIQMDENTRATRSAIAVETTGLITEWYNSLADNSETSRLLRTYIAYPDQLSPTEKYQAIMKLHTALLILQSAFYLEEEGTLDTKIRDSLAVVISSVGAQPGMADYWKIRKSIFRNEKFISFMDGVVSGEGKMVIGDIYTEKDEKK